MSGTIGIIEARMSAGPLAGRLLAPLAERPLLDQLVRRLARSPIDGWWLATTADAADDVVEAWGFELGLRVFRGPGADLLSSFVDSACEPRADWLVRVLADQPFVDAGLVGRLLDARDSGEEAKRSDWLELRGGPDPGLGGRGAHPSTARCLPLGYQAQLLRREALERAVRERAESDSGAPRIPLARRLAEHGRRFDVPAPTQWPARPQWRWVLDSYPDLAMARSAFRLFASEAHTIDYPSMVARLDAHPEITAMNTAGREALLGPR